MTGIVSVLKVCGANEEGSFSSLLTTIQRLTIENKKDLHTLTVPSQCRQNSGEQTASSTWADSELEVRGGATNTKMYPLQGGFRARRALSPVG
jgi:hypothetical protein